MIIRVVDFETTGMPPDAAVCEVGWYDIDPPEEAWQANGRAYLVNPGRPIPPEASAVHHLTDEDVSGAAAQDGVLRDLMAGADIFCAHNAAFERAFFEGGDRPWICTLKVARRMWPEAPSHSNQALRYWRKLPVQPILASPPHRALPDAYVTALLLRDLLSTGVTVDDMIKWSSEPSLLPRITFGKHRGSSWADVPLDYLDWLANKSEMDADVKFTARHYLKLARS